MRKETLFAKENLIKNGYTCVLCRGEENYNSTLRGVKPLIDFLESGRDFCGFFAADKTVGAGAAHLYALLGITELWTNVISEEGKRVLEKNGITVFYEKLVPYIINHAGDGVCPIETAVRGISDSNEALLAIKNALKKLQSRVEE